jgi:hypothetical protein
MKGHEIAENLRNSKHRFTTGVLHAFTDDGEDAFCVMGLKAFEAGVPISRLRKPWNCRNIENASLVYQINDDAANFLVNAARAKFPTTLPTEAERKQAVIDAFDSPKYHDFDFPVEAFIKYLKDTIE